MANTCLTCSKNNMWGQRWITRLPMGYLRIAFVAFMACQAFVLNASVTLSSKARISLITISPGEDLYAAFGHSTLWVLDPEQGIDRVYNYGTFDFEQPNFYLNFVRGHLDYTISVYSFHEQYESARYEGRGLFQQVLRLDSLQKQRMYDFLEWNAQPENRHYLYDFYKDNCATRLRDIVQKHGGEAIVFDSRVSNGWSFRAWMNHFLHNHSWMALGMNVGLGAPADQVTDHLSQMYLPENLKLGFQRATNHGQPLVDQEHLLLDAMPIEDQNMEGHLWMTFLAVSALSVLLTLSPARFGRAGILLDVVLFGATALLGVVLALLWGATDHWVCAWNTDLLWANPISIVHLLLLSKYRRLKFVKIICTCLSLFAIGYLTVAHFLPEKPILLLFPLILALQLRVLYHLYLANRKSGL